MTTSFQKNPDKLFAPASVIKLVAAIVAREWVLDADLDSTVTATAADMYPPTTAQLQTNDVISWRNLFYGLLVPSGNDASLTIGRLVGEMILASESAPPGTGLARFITAMNAKLASLSMTGAIAGSTHGVDTTTRLSARYAAQLLKLAASDPFLKTVMGTLSHLMTITGVNARTYTVVHTIKPAGGSGVPAFPEFVCGKSGSYEGVAQYAVTMIWNKPGGGEACSVVLYSPTATQRYVDLRRIIDFEIAKDAVS